MELLKIAGLQGIIPLVALIILLKGSYEKISYVFSLNDFDKLFIPQNKLKIYETVKYLLYIVAVNLFIMFYSFAISHYFNFSEKSTRYVYNIITYASNITFVIMLLLILYIKVRNKVTFLKSKKLSIIDDWKVVAISFMIHMISFVLIIGHSYYQIFEYKKVNDHPMSEGEFFIASTIVIIIYVYTIYLIVSSARNNKHQQLAYKMKIKEIGLSLFVLKCKDDSTIILGDSSTYEESKTIYLYDIKQGKYTEFEKEQS